MTALFVGRFLNSDKLSSSLPIFCFQGLFFFSFLMHVTSNTLDQRNGHSMTADRLPSTATHVVELARAVNCLA